MTTLKKSQWKFRHKFVPQVKKNSEERMMERMFFCCCWFAAWGRSSKRTPGDLTILLSWNFTSTLALNALIIHPFYDIRMTPCTVETIFFQLKHIDTPDLKKRSVWNYFKYFQVDKFKQRCQPGWQECLKEKITFYFVNVSTVDKIKLFKIQVIHFTRVMMSILAPFL